MFFFQYSNKSISYNDWDLVATSKSGYSRLPFSYVPGQMRYIIFPASPGSAPGLQNMHGPFFFNFQRATFRWEHMINIYWWKKRCYVQLNTWHKVRLCNGHRHYLSALVILWNGQRMNWYSFSACFPFLCCFYVRKKTPPWMSLN